MCVATEDVLPPWKIIGAERGSDQGDQADCRHKTPARILADR
jgi:hypothetical protein